jgi:NADPH2:quinone reductase
VSLVRREEHEKLAHEAGAHQVAVGGDTGNAERFGPHHLVLESVGGNVLGDTMGMLAPGGTCVSFGVSGGTEVTFDVRSCYFTGAAKLHGFILFHEVLAQPASNGLARLSRLVAEGHLEPHVSVEGSREEIGELAQRVLDRGYTGKAILRVGGY